MELKKIDDRSFYIPNPANIGVIKYGNNSTILIDSGLDNDVGKKVLRLLEDNKLYVKTIINTHSHADHCGGNNYIKNKTGAAIYAPELESAIIENPFLEPLYLFSGANPLKDLQNKFLMAQPSVVDYVIKKEEKTLKFDDLEIRVVPLPGHSPNQIGIETGNVLFCADAVFSDDVIKKHKIPFFIDIDKTRETLAFLKSSQYKFYVPCHAEPRESIAGLVDTNLRAIDDAEEYIYKNVEERKTTEQIIREVCNNYQINITGIQQYFLMNTAIMAYLSSLQKRGKLKVEIRDNTFIWESLEST